MLLLPPLQKVDYFFHGILFLVKRRNAKTQLAQKSAASRNLTIIRGTAAVRERCNLVLAADRTPVFFRLRSALPVWCVHELVRIWTRCLQLVMTP